MANHCCAGCHTSLTKACVAALGRKWHAECFRCASCQRTIREDSFTVKEGQPYHQNCYRSLFGVRCYVCHDYVEGAYLTHHWGAVCSKHSEALRCFACTKIIAAEGGIKFNDGRAFCATCQRSLVTSARGAKAHQVNAMRFMEQLGFGPLPKVPVELFNRHHPDFAGQRLGVTKAVTRTGLSRKPDERWVASIGVLGHLPAIQFQEIVIHELYHVWEHTHEISSSRRTSEGVAELCSWLYLDTLHGDNLAIVLKRTMEQRTDKVYGDGFRLAHKAMSRRGFGWLMTQVIRGKLISRC